MQISQGLSVKNTLALFAGIVAVIFIVVGTIAYYAVDSFQGTLEKSTSNATLLRATGSAHQMHDAIRADVVTFLLAFERGESEWMGAWRLGIHQTALPFPVRQHANHAVHGGRHW